MRPLFVPARAVRSTEATTSQLVATGAIGGAWGQDPIDGDVGYRPLGISAREVPWWTQEKSRILAVNAYRANPMAKAIIDTYVSFCVGDSGVNYQCNNPQVRAVVEEWWEDPRNQIAARQELQLRSHLIMGESLLEVMVGAASGVVRYSPIDPGRISEVDLLGGNPLWPEKVWIGNRMTGGAYDLSVVAVDDSTGLRNGEALFWPSFQALDTDVRGTPFLMSIVDQLDSYDTVLSNLVDRTALARYLVWDVEVQGGQEEVDAFVAGRGGTHVPRSGSVEVHNQSVKWEPKTASTGADEDSVAAKSVLTQVAAGAGLAKTWLAEPDGANRATSHTMAEPVRRRVGGVQRMWLNYQREFARFVIDRAVAARRLPAMVEATDPRTGHTYQVPASRSITITGPEIAASDAQITAQTLLNISTGLANMVTAGVMSPEAAQVAARKAWEDYMGVPYAAELDTPNANLDDIAAAADKATTEARRNPVGHG